ncbi:MAG: hypothetical protein MHM6MM_009474, partial [Cercozoa sp. M6MM]
LGESGGRGAVPRVSERHLLAAARVARSLQSVSGRHLQWRGQCRVHALRRRLVESAAVGRVFQVRKYSGALCLHGAEWLRLPVSGGLRGRQLSHAVAEPREPRGRSDLTGRDRCLHTGGTGAAVSVLSHHQLASAAAQVTGGPGAGGARRGAAPHDRRLRRLRESAAVP